MVVSGVDSGGSAINAPPPDTERGNLPMQPQCNTRDCTKPVWARGFCRAHYAWRRRRGKLSCLPRRTAAERFWAKVKKTRGCWVWLAGTTTGYGQFFDSRGMLAHRWAYERLVGPIPEGLTIDHLCRNRLCVNPSHLEAVTGRTNTLRGVGASAIHARKTVCPRGHALTNGNLIKRSRPGRECKICHRDRMSRSRR